MKKIKFLTILLLLTLTLSLPLVQSSPVTNVRASVTVDGGDGEPSDNNTTKPSGGSQGTGGTIEKIVKTVSDWLWGSNSGGSGTGTDSKSC